MNVTIQKQNTNLSTFPFLLSTNPHLDPPSLSHSHLDQPLSSSSNNTSADPSSDPTSPTNLSDSSLRSLALLSDYGNALRFSQQFGNQVRFVPEWGWLLFDGIRWRPNADRQVISLASSSIFSYYDDLSTINDNTLYEETIKHVQRSLSASRLSTLLDLASSFPDILLDSSNFNANPHLLTVLNGTLDLSTGTLHHHNPYNYITHLIPVSYNPHATSQAWDDFLARLTNHDPALLTFLQRAVGYSLTGLTDQGCGFLLTGPGERAQELFLSTLRSLFGSYSTHTLSLRSRSLTPSLLTSRLLTITSETLFSPAHSAALGTLIKAQPIIPPTASSKHPANPIHPTCKLWLSTSSSSDFPPALAHLRSRINLIPVSLLLSNQEASTLTNQLQDDALPAILSWAIQGAITASTQGLQPAPDLILSSPTAQDDQDDLSSFLELCSTNADPTATIRAHELYHAHTLWSRSQGIPPLSERAFGRSLHLRNIRRTRDASGRLYHGLALTVSIEQLTLQLQNSPLTSKIRRKIV